MIRVRVARKDFGDTPVLREVAFELPRGEVAAVLGPSGVGKSTLLRLIAGLDTRFTGEIETDARFGFVFQEPTLLPWRSALDNVRLPGDLPAQAARAALAEVGLAAQAERFPRALSLGQQRRVALARAFAIDPDLLLMDEAFVSLDGPTAARMRALTLEMLARRGAAALIVTHDVLEAAELADRVLLLTGTPGRLTADIRLDAPRGARDPDRLRETAAALAARMA